MNKRQHYTQYYMGTQVVTVHGPLSQFCGWFACELGGESGLQVVIGVYVLLFAGSDNAQHSFQKLATRFAIDAKTQLAFDDRRTQRTLGCIVGRLHILSSDECPQRIKPQPNMTTHAAHIFIAISHTSSAKPAFPESESREDETNRDQRRHK